MTTPDDKANAVASACTPLVEFWTSQVQRAAEHATSVIDSSFDSDDLQAWRRQWFDSLGQATDACLRSPLFLQMLKGYIDALAYSNHTGGPSSATPSPDGQSFANDARTMDERLAQLEEDLTSREDTTREPVTLKKPDPFPGATDAAKSEASAAKGVTPYKIVYEEGTLKLLRYCNDSVRLAEPILICFALVNRPYILDLLNERSVVQRLLERGFDVWLIDWGEPAETDGTLWLEDYVCLFLNNMVNVVCDRVGTSQLSLLGYCMGGTMSTMYAALHPGRVRNLILMAAPIDFGGDEGLLNLWTRRDYFDVDKLIDTFGNCPGELLRFCFQLMKPVQNFAEKHVRFCENMTDPSFVDNFVAVERWANDVIPVAGEAFRQYVKLLYQQNLLVSGHMCLGGTRIRLDAITCPLLLLVAERDHLVPPGSTLALESHVSSIDRKTISINAGHIGLAVSSRAHRTLWPAAANWIADHSTPLA